MSSILQALTSPTFIETALTLLLTAALTGLLVPIVKAKMDERNFRERKEFEEDLARQSKLIDYQAKLLDEIAASLWEYQALALEPTYFQERANQKGYAAAVQQYDQKAPIVLGQIRSQISKIRRFSSLLVYDRFHRLYYDELIPLDVWLIQLVETGSSLKGDWQDHHVAAYTQIGDAIDESLFLLAKDMGFNHDSGVVRRSADQFAQSS